MYYLWHDAQLLVACEIAQKHLVDLFFLRFHESEFIDNALARSDTQPHTKEVANCNDVELVFGRPPISERVNTGYFYPSVPSFVRMAGLTKSNQVIKFPCLNEPLPAVSISSLLFGLLPYFF